MTNHALGRLISVTRRASGEGAIRLSILCGIALASFLAASGAQAEQTVWHFDNLKKVGGFAIESEGQPRIVDGPTGRALRFDGEHDSILVKGRPLIGASAFTVEAVFKPEGGAFEQRFMHVAETDPVSGLDSEPANGRFMFEVRVVGGFWYLDTYLKSKAGGQTLAFKDNLFPLGRWYAVAQTYDGETYRTYVDGVLQGEARVGFEPHGPGNVRIGARMNRQYYFNGAIAEARFTDRALAPEQLLKITDMTKGRPKRPEDQ